MISNDLMTMCGYISALPTPIADEVIDEAAFQAFCAWQVEEGIAAVVVNGTTGEAPTLTLAEQVRQIHLARDITEGRVPVIAGVGANATAHAVEIAQAAARAGADALLVVTPYYNKPPQEGLYRHFRAVHDATDRPILLYDVPSRTGCTLALETIARLAALPRIIGLKDASGDVIRPRILRRLVGDRFRLLSGDDATSLEFLALGGNGCISVVSNVVPKLCGQLYLAAACGEQAAALLIEARLRPLVAALFMETNPVPLKWALHLMRGMSASVRLPLCEPQASTRSAVRAALIRLGLIGPNFLVRHAARAIARCEAV